MNLRLDSRRGEASKVFRRFGRRFLRLTGVRSFVWADGFWWYRWHSDAGIGFTEDWEKPIENFVLRPGGCFVDAGSHVGRWTIRASPFYARILAFEPDPFTNHVLRRNVARNYLRNVLVFATALSNHRDRSTLFNYGPRACNSLRGVHVSGRMAKAGKAVEVRPLDDFKAYFEVPMVLKIDVEGEELKVLEGAATVIEKFRPLIVVEVHFGNETESITEEIQKHAYSIAGLSQKEPNNRWPKHIVAKPF